LNSGIGHHSTGRVGDRTRDRTSVSLGKRRQGEEKKIDYEYSHTNSSQYFFRKASSGR
jgi:hypothetical protein